MDKASIQTIGKDLLKAWAVYYLLKCVVVIVAMYIGERLGFLVFSVDKGPSLREGVAMAWAALAVNYLAVAVVAVFIFRWTVNRFVVSKMVPPMPVPLSLFHYLKAWLLYATVTFALGYLVTLVLEYAVFELVLGQLAEARWLQWLRKAVQPIAFTLVSLLVFKQVILKLLLAIKPSPALEDTAM